MLFDTIESWKAARPDGGEAVILVNARVGKLAWSAPPEWKRRTQALYTCGDHVLRVVSRCGSAVQTAGLRVQDLIGVLPDDRDQIAQELLVRHRAFQRPS